VRRSIHRSPLFRYPTLASGFADARFRVSHEVRRGIPSGSFGNSELGDASSRRVQGACPGWTADVKSLRTCCVEMRLPSSSERCFRPQKFETCPGWRANSRAPTFTVSNFGHSQFDSTSAGWSTVSTRRVLLARVYNILYTLVLWSAKSRSVG